MHIWDMIWHEKSQELSQPRSTHVAQRAQRLSDSWGCTLHMLTEFSKTTNLERQHAECASCLQQIGKKKAHFLCIHYTEQVVSSPTCCFSHSLSIHIFKTDKCWELNSLRRHNSCNCSLIHSWIWNHSDLIGSFYSNVSSETSGGKKSLFRPQWASLSRWEHFILPASHCSRPTQ